MVKERAALPESRRVQKNAAERGKDFEGPI